MVFNLTGMLCILGIMLYPGGWNEWRVQHICPDARIFYLGECSLGIKLAIGKILR